MDTPTFSDDKPFAAVESALEAEIKNLAKQGSSPSLPPQMQELEGLKSELQKLQEFLSSEVGRVQQEIESALAGITIIVETIAPWKSMASVTPPNIARSARARPPTNVEAVSY